MDAIEALLSRQSCSRLVAPGPDGKQRETIFQAALTAPDHAALRPWRYLVIEGDARNRLGERMLKAALLENPGLDDAKRDKLLAAPLRAPLVIIAVARYEPHPKVPEIEQQLSTGAAVAHMLLAIHALGFAGIWRTGSMAFSRPFMESLELSKDESIVGILYVGTPEGRRKSARDLDTSDYFQPWMS